MKRCMFVVLVAVILSSAVFAAPTDEEVASTFAGVFGVYSGVFLSTMMGQTVPGASLDMDMQSGASSLNMDNVDAIAVFENIGAMMDESDVPEIPFKTISGSFTTKADSSMELDVSMGGGPVKKMVMRMEGEDLTLLTADGKDFTHITNMMELMAQ